MANIFIEHRNLSKGVALTWDLAHHLYVRQTSNRVIVVADNPPVMLAALRKQWLKVVLKLRNEYSRTLQPERKQTLQQLITRMEQLPFQARLPKPGETGGVFFICPADIEGLDDPSTTIYTTCPIPNEELLIEKVAYHGLLAKYLTDFNAGSK